jgi:hypothetical protein
MVHMNTIKVLLTTLGKWLPVCGDLFDRTPLLTLAVEDPEGRPVAIALDTVRFFLRIMITSTNHSLFV